MMLQFINPKVVDGYREAHQALLQELVRDALEQVQGTGMLAHDDRLLDAEEVAKMLGVDTTYVYSQAKAGKIPSIKVGKYRKFSPSKLSKWLERNAS